MRKVIALMVVPALALGGCSVFGNKQAKSLDEFAVARNAPLVIPPDFALTPPVAGAVSSSPESAQGQAIEALFGGPAARSETETSMLDTAGRDRAIVGTRSVAGDPDTRLVDKGAETQAIIAAPESSSQEATANAPQ